MSFGSWVLETPLGEGSTAHVWRARDSGGRPAALKIHNQANPIHHRHFVNEYGGLRAFPPVPGLIPLLDGAVPDQPGPPAWLAFPIVDVIDRQFGQNQGSAACYACAVSVAGTVARLAACGIALWDFKSGHIARLGPDYVLIDHGLTAFPGVDAFPGREPQPHPDRYWTSTILSWLSGQLARLEKSRLYKVSGPERRFFAVQRQLPLANRPTAADLAVSLREMAADHA